MWPKRKKGKARATKVKLKALQQEQDGNESESEDASAEQAPAAAEPAQNPMDDAISGVWKAKVLNNYKQNPRNSHNLLARIPTGKAAFEAGERQKAELIRESMIKIVDRMFDNFQNTAYEFNAVTGGSDLELTWIRPHFVTEEISSWHDNSRGQIELFTGRISTRYWTLAVRGTVAGIGSYILPSDKLIAFSSSPSSYPCYLSIIPESDGMNVEWLIAKKPIDQDLFPSVYRALLDGLIRFASDEAQHGEAFRLEDIGIVPEAPPPTSGPPGYLESETPDLLGQSSARNLVISSPKISAARDENSSADRFIDSISNQVAQAAQSETDKFRESMHAPPFGTSQRNMLPPSPDDIRQSGFMSVSEPPAAPAVREPDPEFRQSGFMSVSEPETIDRDSEEAVKSGEWKVISPGKATKGDWREFMESTKEQIQSGGYPKDEQWNSAPNAQAQAQPLARPEPFRNSGTISTSSTHSGMQSSVQSGVQSPVPPGPNPTYASYGSADDPPELLRLQTGTHVPISQNDILNAKRAMEQSGVHSAQEPPQWEPPEDPPQVPKQMSPHMSHQSLPQMPPPQVPPPGQPQMAPPQLMPPGYPPQGLVPNPNMQQRPMMTHPGLPSMPGMINQSGVHPQPMIPGYQQGVPPQVPPPGMPPQGMPPRNPQGLPPGMPPHMMPGQPGDVSGQYQNQYNTGGHGALPPHLAAQYNTGPHAQQMPPQQQQQQFNTGAHAQLPPPYPPQVPGQYHPGPYGTVHGRPVHDPRAFQPVEPAPDDHVPYLLSESDFNEQEESYEAEEESYTEVENWEDQEHTEGDGSEEAEVEVEESFEEGATVEVEEATWEEPAISDASHSGFPQESYQELPVVSREAMQRLETANKAGFVFSTENDLVDAISVVLATIDAQIELLAKEGTEAFTTKDFRKAESIIKLSERLNSFKAEAQAIFTLMSEKKE